jgi:hypothetical protein
MSNTPSIEYIRKTLPARITGIAWILFALGIVLTSVAYLLDVKLSAFNNVVGFLFLTSLAGGSVFLVALEYIAGAVWSVPMKRVSEFLSGLLPVAPLLAIPLLLQMHVVFPWIQPETTASESAQASNSAYLNLNFFIIRFLVIFMVLNLFYFLFTRNSTKQDTSRDPRLTTMNIRLSAVFMPIFAILISIIAIDWAMSLTPHWYSTIFGVYYFAGTVLAGLAAGTYIIVKLHDAGYFPTLHRDHFYSLGALLFAFINFWAYIAFSQFLLIWYANLPEETVWFMSRWKDGWQYVSILLIIVQFAVPYFALLTQDSKMDLKRLKFMAIWILCAHFVDIFWLVMPAYGVGVPLSWMELGFPILIVGLTMLVVSYKLNHNNLVPVGDPKLERGLRFRL